MPARIRAHGRRNERVRVHVHAGLRRVRRRGVRRDLHAEQRSDRRGAAERVAVRVSHGFSDERSDDGHKIANPGNSRD